MSIIEQLIKDRNFAYLPPYFYSNNYALRCELGTGASATEDQITIAYEKASEIYSILFPHGADALFFNYLIFDYSVGSNGDMNISDIEKLSEKASEEVSFLLSYQNRYRNLVVTDLEKDSAYGAELIRRNRVICYPDDNAFDHSQLIRASVRVDLGGLDQPEISFVSFKNECILSIYDDRGCDIVFATKEKYREFFIKLRNYLFRFDLEEMKKRFDS